jgi:hypothetical protein
VSALLLCHRCPALPIGGGKNRSQNDWAWSLPFAQAVDRPSGAVPGVAGKPAWGPGSPLHSPMGLLRLAVLAVASPLARVAAAVQFGSHGETPVPLLHSPHSDLSLFRTRPLKANCPGRSIRCAKCRVPTLCLGTRIVRMVTFQIASFVSVWDDLAYILAWIKDNVKQAKHNFVTQPSRTDYYDLANMLGQPILSKFPRGDVPWDGG